MAFSLSPGVNVTEIDLTTVVPRVATTDGGLAGVFNWGPAQEVTLIDSEDNLVRFFGKPNDDNCQGWYTAANFLSYSNKLRLVRAADDDSYNACGDSGASSIRILNKKEFEAYSGTLPDSFSLARYVGVLGNSLKVEICPSPTAFATWSHKTLFGVAPGTSSYAEARSGLNDECHVAVIDVDGKISGVAGRILEKYTFVSKSVGAKSDDGSSSYYKDVINNKSRYVYIINKPSGSEFDDTIDAHYSGTAALIEETLVNGSDGTTPDLEEAYDLFKNAEDIDISLIMMGNSNSVANHVITAIAESRKDCVVFVSPLEASVVNNADPLAAIKADRVSLSVDSSYAVMDSGYKYQYDKYNDVYRYSPLNGDIAGLCARTDADRDPWWSPAGLNRGKIKNCIKLAYNPKQADRDDLYVNGINPVVTFPGSGPILYGDKTLQIKPSAFDRINVRRLFIVLEKAIAIAARYSLFEFNDTFTRASFKNMVEPYLRGVKAGRGIYDYRVVCDETNNTAEVIDHNEFVGDIYIKPARSINFIQLNFIAVRTGVTFEEVVGKF
jgi:hypothetical protein